MSKCFDLRAIYDARQTFYGKAVVIVEDNGSMFLRSYGTVVAEIQNKGDGIQKAIVYGDYSQTTLRHIKEFLKQNGFFADNKKQILTDYAPNENA